MEASGIRFITSHNCRAVKSANPWACKPLFSAISATASNGAAAPSNAPAARWCSQFVGCDLANCQRRASQRQPPAANANAVHIWVSSKGNQTSRASIHSVPAVLSQRGECDLTRLARQRARWCRDPLLCRSPIRRSATRRGCASVPVPPRVLRAAWTPRPANQSRRRHLALPTATH